MIETVTYHSINAKPSEAWLAYIVLADGTYWLVRFHGASESEAISRATTAWEKELLKPRAKQVDLFNGSTITFAGNGDAIKSLAGIDDPWAEVQSTKLSGRGSHLVGKMWVINNVTREKQMTDAETGEALIATGEWSKGGARSK